MTKNIFPILIIIASITFSFFLIKAKKRPIKKTLGKSSVPVEIAVIKPAKEEIPLAVTGTVQAKYSVKLVPQVSGLVIWVDPKFLRGEAFKKGQLLFKIDDTDYLTALEEARARLTKAKLELEIIKAKSNIAKREWELQEHKSKDKPLPLVFYKPQYENALQEVKAAQSLVKKAEVDLSRTKIVAPFDCYVKSESVEIGHYIRSGTTVAELVYSKQAEVVLPIEEEHLAWIRSEEDLLSQKGSKVDISIPGAGIKIKGIVDRISPFVNEKTRLVDVFVIIDDPFCIINHKMCRPVAIGTFVTAKIMATPPKGSLVIPVSALKEDGRIYLVSDNNTLSIKKVNLIYMTEKKAWIKGKVRQGQKVVVSSISGVSEGMKVKIVSKSQ